MSDDKNVVSLDEKRAEKSGRGFWLQPWDFDDEALGFTGGDHPVVFVTTNEGDDAGGICMTQDTVRRLRDALTGVLESPHAPWATPTGSPDR